MLNTSIIKLVGFDLDQTLYKETAETHRAYRETVYRLLAKELKIPLKEAEGKFKKNYAVLGSGTETVRVLGVKNPEEFSAKVSNNCKVHLHLKKDPKLIDLIRYLQEKYVLFLITTSAKQSSYKKLRKMGLDPKKDFKYAAFGDDKETGKARGKSFTKLLKLSKEDPKKHVFVGDKSATDIIPAKRLGMQTVMAWGKSKEADLSVPTIYKLKEWL